MSLMENKISVAINTYNEENSLGEILEYLKGFDEIVVCDMESTDGTVRIAKEFGCRVVTFPKGDYNIAEPARNFAIQSATYPWVLVIPGFTLNSFSSVDQSYLILCDPMDCSTPGFPVHHQLPKLAQTQVQ